MPDRKQLIERLRSLRAELPNPIWKDNVEEAANAIVALEHDAAVLEALPIERERWEKEVRERLQSEAVQNAMYIERIDPLTTSAALVEKNPEKRLRLVNLRVVETALDSIFEEASP